MRCTGTGTAVGDLPFDRSVALVFDDMVARSVPFYHEIQRMLVELAHDFAVPGSAVYDLGCATGTTLVNLHRALDPSVRFVGVDNAAEMLDEARGKLAEHGVDRPVELECRDLNEGVTVTDASVALMVLTLQFIRPLRRDRVVEQCSRAAAGRRVLLVERCSAKSIFNRLLIDTTTTQAAQRLRARISQKHDPREVLIPPSAGTASFAARRFRYVDVFFKWYNFAGSSPSSDGRLGLPLPLAQHDLSLLVRAAAAPARGCSSVPGTLVLSVLVTGLGQAIRALTIGLRYQARRPWRKVYANDLVTQGIYGRPQSVTWATCSSASAWRLRQLAGGGGRRRAASRRSPIRDRHGRIPAGEVQEAYEALRDMPAWI
jgi:tRNA (cmo5U34)-methyltransferase